ncbi:MAG TPA: glycerophosphoryl diester phosphodiesterase membrane domain-containing protein [Gaiellaceae bacterium]|nr:glycerophosphoryl diester phosphodiesterase membrane domain-containing protein [Gaiellaceae bacterium]
MIGGVLSDAARVYRRLWRRSVLVAGAVFLVVAAADGLAALHPTRGTELVSIALALIGSLLVQGALVEVVRDVHEGREPAPPVAYYERTRNELATLLVCAVFAGIGVALGFLLFIVPGLILLARWTLIVPLVMVEGRSVRDAFSRSNELVTGKTLQVLAVVVLAGLVTTILASVATLAFGFLPTFWSAWIGGTIGGAIAAPYEAHALTVLYYRLTEPDRPILPA